MPLQYDPEFHKLMEPIMELMAPTQKPPVHDISARRIVLEGLIRGFKDQIPDTADVNVTEHRFKARDGTSIPIFRFAKKGSGALPGPAILHCHGGGMIMGSVASFDKVLATFASETAVQIFSVDYRLAPEHKGLILVEDCFTALIWLHQHVQEFNVNPKRIAIMGESAGGGIAAGVTLLARDRGLSPPLAKQILIYPMLDDRNTRPVEALVPFATWTYEDNLTGWTALLGDETGKDGVSPYAAPARAEDVDGLPPTYIDVGELDIFRDEVIKYASQLAAANISTELHLYPGVPHAFEVLGAKASVSERAMVNRKKAMTSF